MFSLKRPKLAAIFASLITLSCSSGNKLPPLEPVAAVDLSKFMGDWYVMANIPTFLEKGAHNAIEHYDMKDDGSIAIRFTFRKGAFDGPEKILTMNGYPLKEFNDARWEVSPFWPLRLPYYTIDLAQDYSWVMVATPNRNYLWIMSRDRSMPQTMLQDLIDKAVNKGFIREEIQVVPQKW